MNKCSISNSNPNHEYATKILCDHFEWDAAFDHPFLKELPELIVIRNIFEQPDSSRVHAIDNLIADESNDQRPDGSAIADRMGEALFVSLLRNWIIDQQSDASMLATLNDPKLSHALRNMHLNPQQDIDLNKLACVAGMSRTAFAIRFCEVLGTPPAAYLTDWRMMTARRLLMNTQLTTADITERTGYSSDSAFKRRFGHTPGSIRQA